MSKEYDKQVGRYTCDADYCDICGCDLVTSMELNSGRCNKCIENEDEKQSNEI